MHLLNATGEIISGIILMTVLGLSIGNYATSIVYRLPRGLKIANEPPYCECERRMYLQVRDNFPFFSWLMSRGKCRWCDIRIPGLYAMVELACGLLFVTGLWRFGLGDALILVLALGVFLITQFALYYCERRLYTIIVLVLCGFGAMYRILLDGTVFGFFRGALMALVLSAIVWRLGVWIKKSKETKLPDYVVLFAVAGGCTGAGGTLSLLAVSMVAWAAVRLVAIKDQHLEASAVCFAISLATLILLYYPKIVF